MNQLCRLLLLSLVLLVGCSHTVYVNGIPNLVQVEPGLWRSGQPTTLEQWRYLQSLGIRKVVKLNFESEGSDDGAVALGMTVYNLSIQPQGDLDWFDNVANAYVRPDVTKLQQADEITKLHDGVLVHCTHGQDRTGESIGRHRVLVDHWSAEDAYAEMLRLGFHPMLHGLHEAWETFAVGR
jgi:protein tyrosine/serine phosphatase